MSAKKTQCPAPPEKLAFYERLVATQPEVERNGAAMPYTSLDGNMFSYLSADGTAALRLPAADRERFLQEHGASLMTAHGIVQKEYVAVPDSLLADTERLEPYFAASFAYAKALKPKPTKRS